MSPAAASTPHSPAVAAPAAPLRTGPHGSVPSRDSRLLSPTECGLHLVGLTAMSAVAALGAPDLTTWAGFVPMIPGICLGTALLSAPPLFVAGPLLDLQLHPSDVLAALGTGLARAGRLAWSLLPALAFFTLTTQGWRWIWLMGFVTVALGAVRATRRALHSQSQDLNGTHLLFGAAWAALAVLVGCRLLIDFLSSPTW